MDREIAALVEPVQVFIRIRPEFKTDTDATPHVDSIKEKEKCIHMIDDKTIKFSPPDAIYGNSRKGPLPNTMEDKIFTFDNVFNEWCSQDEVYEKVRSHVKATIKGYNTTIFAYGSTGSGKSYTMTGTTSQPGIIPRAIAEIFSSIETAATEGSHGDSDVFFYVRLSYVELYNNNFRNLLEFASKELSTKEKEDNISENKDNFGLGLKGKHKIEVRESVSAGVFLAGPSLRIPVTTAQEAYALINRGNKARAVGATQCNDVSSRSHAVLTVHVESRLLSAPTNSGKGVSELRLGKMHLVDLAGSERVSMSGAEGDTLVETQSINLSLSAIGDVLSALSRNATIMNQYDKALLSSSKLSLSSEKQLAANMLVPVPYRNSKLTHLLKDSLGGNSKTIMITTIRSSSEYYQLTAASLMYSSRAKKIKNRSLVNHDVIGDTGIYKVTNEIDRLRLRLEERTREFERLCVLQLEDAKENMALKSRLQEMQSANESEKRELENQMSQVIHSQAGQLANQKERIEILQHSLEQQLSLSLARIAEQEQEIKKLQRALTESAQAIQDADQWQSILNSIQTELKIAQDKINELKSENKYLNDELITIKAYAEESDQIKEDSLSSARNLEEQLRYYQAKSVSLEKKFNELELITKDFVENKLKQDIEITELKTKCSQINQMMMQYKDSNERMIAEVESKKTKLSVLEKENKELKMTINSSIGNLEQQTSSIIDRASVMRSHLEDENIRLKERVEAHENEKAKYELQINSLSQQLLAVQSNSTTDHVHAKYISEIDALKVEIEKALSIEKERSNHLFIENERMKKQLSEYTKSSHDRSDGNSKETIELRAKVQELNDEKSQIQVKYESIIKDLNENNLLKIEEALNAQRIKYKLLMKEKGDDIMQSCQDEYNNKLKEIEDNHSKYVSKLITKYESALSVEKEECRALQLSHEAKLKSIREQELALHQLNESYLSKIDNISAELEVKEKIIHDNKNELTLKQIHDLNSIESNKEKKLKDEIDALKSSLDSLSKQLVNNENEYKLKVDVHTAGHQRQLTSLKEEYHLKAAEKDLIFEMKFRDQSMWYEQRLQELQDENEAVVTNMNKSADDRVLELQEELASLRHNIDSNYQSIINDLSNEISSLKERERNFFLEQESLENTHREFLEAQQEEHNRSIETIKAQQEDAKVEALAKLHESYSQIISGLEDKMAVAEVNAYKSMAEVDTQASRERELKFEALRAETNHRLALAEKTIRDECNNTLAKLISQHSLEHELVSIELQQTRSKLLRCYKEYEETCVALSDLEESFEVQVERRLLQLKSDVSDVMLANQNLLEKNEKLQKERDEHISELESIMDKMRDVQVLENELISAHEKIKSLESDIENEKKQIESLILSFEGTETERNKRIADLKELYENEVKALVDNKHKCFKRIEDLEHDIESATLSADKYKSSEKSLRKEIADLRDQLNTEITSNETKLAEVREDYDMRLASSVAALELTKRTLEEEMQGRVSAVMTEMKTMRAHDNAEINRLVEELHEAQVEVETLTACIHEKERLYEAELSRLKNSNSAQLAELQAKLKEGEDCLEKARIEYAEQLDEMGLRFESEMSESWLGHQQQQAADMDDLRVSMAAEMQAAKEHAEADANERIKRIRGDYESKVKALEEEVKESNSSALSLTNKLQQRKAELEYALSESKSNAEAVAQNLQDLMTEREAALSNEVSTLAEDHRDRERRHTDALIELREGFEKQRRTWKEEATQLIAKYSEELRILEEKRMNEISSLTAALDESNSKCNDLSNEFKSRRLEYEILIADTRSKSEQELRQAATLVQENESKYGQLIQSLQTELNSAKSYSVSLEESLQSAANSMTNAFSHIQDKSYTQVGISQFNESSDLKSTIEVFTASLCIQLEQLKSEKSEISNALQVTNDKYLSAEGLIDSLKREFVEYKKKSDINVQEVEVNANKSINNTLEEYKSLEAAYARDMAVMNEKHVNAEREKETLLEQIQAVTRQFKSDMDTMQQSYLKEIESTSSALQLSESDLRILANELDNLKTQSAIELESTKRQAHIEMTKLRDDISRLESSYNQQLLLLNKQVEIKDSLIVDLQSRTEDGNKERSLMDMRLSNSKVNERQLEGQLAQQAERFQQEMNSISATKSLLQNELTSLKNALAESQMNNTTIQSKLAQAESLKKSELDFLIESHQKALFLIKEESNAKLLASETNHITKLEEVHGQLKEVEVRHNIRVGKLEEELAKVNDEKVLLQSSLQSHEAEFRRMSQDMGLLNDELTNLRMCKVSFDSERSELEALLEKKAALYGNEIGELLGLVQKYKKESAEAALKMQSIQNEVTILRKTNNDLLVEKRVLEDICSKALEGRSSDENSVKLHMRESTNSDSSSGLRERPVHATRHTYPPAPNSASLAQRRNLSSSVSVSDTDDAGAWLDIRDSVSSFSSEPAMPPVINKRRNSYSESYTGLTSERRPSRSTSSHDGMLFTPPPALFSSYSKRKSSIVSTSPTDLLIASILDGDAESTQSVIRARGGDFKSAHWKEVAAAVCPLHRAFAGLQYHGDDKLLVSTLSILLQLGANINGCDRAGNSVLHAAIHACSSKLIPSILEMLLVQGANPNVVNKAGEAPLHIECAKSRSASVEVITLLLENGARTNIKLANGLSPISLLLTRASALANEGHDNSRADNRHVKMKSSCLQSIGLLLKKGAKWEPSFSNSTGQSQLFLLYGIFPPSPLDVDLYIRLILNSIESGIPVNKEDSNGYSAMFILCNRLTVTPYKECPDCLRVIRAVITAHGKQGFGVSGRRGELFFDSIEGGVEGNCLSQCRSALVEAVLRVEASPTSSSDATEEADFRLSSRFDDSTVQLGGP